MSVHAARMRPPAALRLRARLSRVGAPPELLALVGITALLNLWGLSINGWANTYYSAAVRAMSTSWHNFLFASADPSGLMTVDKPPLSLWVQALSVRVFGFHPLSILVPQALMGVAAAALTYDLVRRRFGRPAGFVAGLVLATTPVAVAVSRHNNPDELLTLCCVAAVWCALRALDSRRTRWLVLSGVCVGLGFETKMAVALMVVPGIAAAYVWLAPRASRPLGLQLRRIGRRASHPAGRLRALRQLLAGATAMVAVAGAWPLLVTLTPAADRPWISGTSDNSIWSLIFGYNGLGRLAGQSGGPGGGGGPGRGTMFGGPTGFFRLLQSGLGDQASWLLGFAVVAGLALLVLTRLRSRDPRTGWLLVVGGAFATSAVVFSFASGIFHPYYVSQLAPFAAALVGAGVGLMLGKDRATRVIAPLAIGAGAITELVVLGTTGGALSWARPLVIALGGGCAVLLALRLAPRLRTALIATAIVALLAAPAAWAVQTLGHVTNGTFPTGGPANAARSAPAGRFSGGPPPGGLAAPPRGGGFPGGPAGGFPAGPSGANSSTIGAAIRYAKAHGGGTIAIASQSSAAAAILSSQGNVAGIGGFSGRESSVTVSWLASQVRSGRLRWLLVDGGQGPRLPGDTRTGSSSTIAAAEKACRAVTFTATGGTAGKMYDCSGSVGAILQAAQG